MDKTEYTSAQVAAELGTEAKVLRRFLRATPEWANPGSGGRYSFTRADIKVIKKQFPTWVAGQAKAKPSRRAKVTATPGGVTVVPAVDPEAISTMRKKVDTSESPEVWDGPLPDARTVRIEGAARAARLDAMLRASGMHLSQWTPDRWAKAGVGN